MTYIDCNAAINASSSISESLIVAVNGRSTLRRSTFLTDNDTLTVMVIVRSSLILLERNRPYKTSVNEVSGRTIYIGYRTSYGTESDFSRSEGMVKLRYHTLECTGGLMTRKET